jgi:hypothetical protein
MTLILQVVAAVLTVLGAGTLYWGTSPSLLSLGNFVMVVGAIIAASGIILFGLAAVLGQLGVLGRKLDDLHNALAGSAPAPVPERMPAPIPVPEPAVALEPLRAIEPEASFNFAPPVGAPEPAPEPRRPEPAVAPPPVPAASTPAPSRHSPAMPAPATPAPAMPTPPTRASFGLKPIAATAAVAAGAAAVVAATPSKAEPAAVPAEPSAPEPESAEAEKAEPEAARVEAAHADIEEIHIEPIETPVIEPVLVEPAKDHAEAEKHASHDESETADPMAALSQALEEMKEEVKAAEADLEPAAERKPAKAEPEPAAEDRTASADHMASLEKLLLGEPPAAARTPAAVDTDDFMARLRETISRPVVPPAPPEPTPPAEPEEEPEAAEPPPVDEPEPAAPAPAAEPVKAEPARTEPAAPRFSIEDELERALKASLEEGGLTSPRTPPIDLPPLPPPPQPAPPERPAPPVPPAERVEPPSRDQAMAALARDFPELGDLLGPKPAAVDPAGSLITDLQDIFETKQPEPRREPSPPPPPPPSAPQVPLLREGVIAGIPFRLYGDGTIEADLPVGTTRFASLKEFRAHVGG